MRQVRFDIVDAVLHSQSRSRSRGQILPTLRRACYASVLTWTPKLQEPVFSIEVIVPWHATDSVYEVVEQYGGALIRDGNFE